jgi:hypothetical protein
MPSALALCVLDGVKTVVVWNFFGWLTLAGQISSTRFLRTA